MEINGYKVAKYNIHGIPEGAKMHTCPLCSESRKKKTDKCLKLNWLSGFGKCFHCGEVVQLHEWAKKEIVKDYKVPTWSNETKLSDSVVRYFEGRKINQFTLRLFKISEGIESMKSKKTQEYVSMRTIQFPYFRMGEVVDIKYRGASKEFKLFSGAERIPYNLDNVANEEIVYWVEGEIDALSVTECGIHNVTSVPNGFVKPRPDGVPNINLDFLDNTIDFFKETKKHILVFDNDEPGINGKNEFIRRFGTVKCYTVDLLDCKDSNEFLVKYGSEALKKALENYSEIPLTDISTYKDHKEQVREFFLNGMPKGYITGVMSALDDTFSVNFSHLVLVTGIPSHGKSECVDQICCGYALKYDFKIAFASVENKPNALHIQKLIRKIRGITPRVKTDFNKSFEDCEDFIEDHFYFIDMDFGYDLDGVLKKAEELVFRKGIRVLVIDPFNKVRLTGNIPTVTGNRINDYTSQYLNKLNEFGYKHDVIVYLVAHPIKLEKDTTGKRVIPDFYDVKGGGEFYDMCHHGLVIYRDKMFDLTLVRTLKVKFANLGNSGVDCWYKYNINNGRLNDVTGDPNGSDPPTVDWDNTDWLISKTGKRIQLPTQEDLWYNVDKEFEQEEVPF